jgi:phospholipase/carboxylesterase
VGADAASFADLGRTLARGLPRADFLVVDGFHPWDGGGSGRQWFSLRGVTDANRGQRIRDAGVEVSEYLDDELGRRHLGGERLVLVGFSQGAMMTGYLTVHRTPRPAAAVMLSGRVAMDDVPTKAESPTPLLWAHGDADGVIPVSAVEPGTRVLQTWGAQVTTRIYPGMGHQVSPQELTEVEDFLRGVLPKAN